MLSKRQLAYVLTLALLFLIIPAIQLEEGAIASEYQEPLSYITLNNVVRELVNIDFSPPQEGDYLIKPNKNISFEKQRAMA